MIWTDTVLAFIVLAVAIVAIEPAERLLLRYHNWKARQLAHDRWQKRHEAFVEAAALREEEREADHSK